MGDFGGVAVCVARAPHLADEWAVVLAAGSIPHRLRLRLDGWALIVAVHDAEAAREALGAYDQENIADTVDMGDGVAPVRGAASGGVAVGLLLIGCFAITGTPASGSVWFERGSASAERIVAGEWWRTVTALTLYADAPHVLGNAAASVVLVGAVSQNRPRCRPLAATPRRRRRQRPHRRRPRRPPQFRGRLDRNVRRPWNPRRHASHVTWTSPSRAQAVDRRRRKASRCLPSSARARMPISSLICSASYLVAPWAWSPRSRCRYGRRRSGRSPSPSWR
jgi:hypothetical protein